MNTILRKVVLSVFVLSFALPVSFAAACDGKECAHGKAKKTECNCAKKKKGAAAAAHECNDERCKKEHCSDQGCKHHEQKPAA